MKKLEAAEPETRSADLVAENVDRLKALFPEVVTEGPDGVAVNVDVLKALVGDRTVTDCDEKYGLNWHGKRRARQLALTTSTGTLRPCPAESLDWDTTQNLMIEGDNLEVLKILQKSYAGRVKIIYIDPPYNTGNEFIYPDKHEDNLATYLRYTGQIDDDGFRTSTNSESSGRFHTNWLRMMYSRLRLARNLLRSDGVFFASIDNHEVASLRRICDEVFGEEAFLGFIVRSTGQTTGQDSGGLGSSFDFILAYGRDPEVDLCGIPLTKKDLKRFENEDERGSFAYDQMRKTGSNDRREDRPQLYYPVEAPDGTEIWPIGPGGYHSCWRFEREAYERLKADNYILWKKTVREGVETWWPYVKYYAAGRTKRPSPLWTDLAGNKKASRDLRALFEGKKVFDFPKPVALIERLIQIAPNANKDDVILDFFAGSGTTGHAVTAQNAADSGSRRYILVQLPEPLDPCNKDQKSAAEFCDKLGKPLNIAELTKERLRRTAKKINDEKPMFAGDLGFRVFRLDSSNIRTWDPDRDDLEGSLIASVEHLKEGRSELDVFYELLLKLGLDLCVPIETRTVVGKDIRAVGGGVLLVCLVETITADEVESLAQGIIDWRESLAPAGNTTCVFRDSAFADDVAKTNMVAILEQCGIAHVRSL